MIFCRKKQFHTKKSKKQIRKISPAQIQLSGAADDDYYCLRRAKQAKKANITSISDPNRHERPTKPSQITDSLDGEEEKMSIKYPNLNIQLLLERIQH
jgi:hypothetical protein